MRETTEMASALKSSKFSAFLVLVLFVATTALFAQKKKKPAAPKKPAAKTVPKGKTAVTPAVETRKTEPSEINPDPDEQIRKAKEEASAEKNQKLMVENQKSIGTVTVRMTYGFYNFDSKISNTSLNEERSYSLTLPTQLYGAELAIRLGKDPDKFHSPEGAAFSYYRSNRGLFTDFELGFKTQKDDQPSVFDMKKTKNGVQTNSTIDLAPEYTSADFLSGSPTDNVKRLKDAGISPAFKNSLGPVAAQMTMVYLNSYYHFTPMNFIFNFGSKFRWFDASLGPSLRIWYYTDYSDPMKGFEYNDDNTAATLMLVYRQYIQIHDRVRLRGHYYFPAATMLARSLKSGMLNEEEHILDAGIDIYVYNFLYVTVAYEAHWFKSNPYSNRRNVTTGFKDDSGFFDTNYQGFEKTTRESSEIYFGLAIDVPLKL